MTQIIHAAWSSGVVPSEWKKACTILIHKNGGTDNTANFRPITLQSVPLKVFTSCLRNKTFQYLVESKYIEQNIQKGFTPKLSGTLEHTAQVVYKGGFQHIFEKLRKKKNSLHQQKEKIHWISRKKKIRCISKKKTSAAPPSYIFAKRKKVNFFLFVRKGERKSCRGVRKLLVVRKYSPNSHKVSPDVPIRTLDDRRSTTRCWLACEAASKGKEVLITNKGNASKHSAHEIQVANHERPRDFAQSPQLGVLARRAVTPRRYEPENERQWT